MRKTISGLHYAAALLFLFMLLLPTAFAADGSGSSGANLLAAYGITTVLSLLFAGGYCAMVKQKDTWLLLLFIAVVIVNLGYFSLAISKTLEEALLANRISYFGSVFLPLCILMTISRVCRIPSHRTGIGVLLVISSAVFLLAASPGYHTCYYSDVSLVVADGVASLQKVYGPMHIVYLVYLLVYYGLMIGVIIWSSLRKRPMSMQTATILLGIVTLNIAIWAIEKVTDWRFEFLAVSYIVSELMLLQLVRLNRKKEAVSEQAVETITEVKEQPVTPEPAAAPQENTAVLSEERIAQIRASWPAIERLTARETDVLYAILENKKRKRIAEELNVTEHTVKKHTANIFAKVGVTNRAELFAKADEETPKE